MIPKGFVSEHFDGGSPLWENGKELLSTTSSNGLVEFRTPTSAPERIRLKKALVSLDSSKNSDLEFNFTLPGAKSATGKWTGDGILEITFDTATPASIYSFGRTSKGNLLILRGKVGASKLGATMQRMDSSCSGCPIIAWELITTSFPGQQVLGANGTPGTEVLSLGPQNPPTIPLHCFKIYVNELVTAAGGAFAIAGVVLACGLLTAPTAESLKLPCIVALLGAIIDGGVLLGLANEFANCSAGFAT